MAKQEKSEKEAVLAADNEGTIKVEAVESTTIDGKRLEKGQQMEVTKSQFAALAARLKRVGALALLGLLALLFCGQAQAQVYRTSALYCTNNVNTNWFYLNGATGTNCIMAITSTNTLNAVIPLTKYGDVCLQAVMRQQTAVGTTNYIITLDASCDGVNWSTNWSGLTIVPNGTNFVTALTNITVNSIGYLRVSTISNPNGSILTNLNVFVTYKPSRFGL